MSAALPSKVAPVPGGGTGIGEAAALALAAAGVKVAISGRRAEKLDQVVAAIEAAGGAALAVPSDASLEADAFDAVDRTVTVSGRLDIVIDSAGLIEAGGVQSLSLEV